MKYQVRIKATITKNIIVKADNKAEAEDLAHEQFNINCEGSEERYEQETVNLKESTT